MFFFVYLQVKEAGGRIFLKPGDEIRPKPTLLATLATTQSFIACLKVRQVAREVSQLGFKREF